MAEQKINYEKLKQDMDAGGEFSTEYLIQIDTHIEDENDYKLVDEFGSTLSEIERAVDCYFKTGADKCSFI
jgi:hypothetical protein